MTDDHLKDYGQIDQSGNLDATKNNGQLARVESFIGSSKQWTQKFSYDSLGRLDKAEEYRGDTNALSYKQTFDFDKFGNLYRKASANPTAGQATPLPYTPIEDSDISKSTNRFTTGTTYDEAGNVISDAKFRQMNFAYDANGRMITAVRANAPDAVSIYDASGQRVAEKVNDVWKFSIYDAFGKMVAEYGGLSATDDGGVKYVLQDWQGSSRAIVSQGGFVQSRMDYTAFGEEIYSGTGQRTTAQGFNATNNLSQKYAQTERDKATGLDHTWFRKLENRAGRWTSPDPYNGSMNLGSPQSFNRYAYVENQPTNFVDPSGLQLRYYDVSQGMGCVLKDDGKFHCTEYINRYWYDDGIGNYDPGYGGDFGGGGGQGNSPDPKEVERLINACLLNLSIIPKDIYDAISNNKNDVQSLFLSLAHAAIESSLNPKARGGQGEIGLFQLKPSTANDLGMGKFTVAQLENPATNTKLGTTHLQNLINSFGGDVRTALGAYKQGERGVRDNGLTKDSQEYADGILGCEKKFLK